MAETFSAALKRYHAAGYGAREAMRATWQDVKIGRVARPRARRRILNPLNPQALTGRAASRLVRADPAVLRRPRRGYMVRLSDGRALAHDAAGYYLVDPRRSNNPRRTTPRESRARLDVVKGRVRRLNPQRTVDMLEDGARIVRHVFYGRTAAEARAMERAHAAADRSLAAALAGRRYRGIRIDAQRPGRNPAKRGALDVGGARELPPSDPGYPGHYPLGRNAPRRRSRATMCSERLEDPRRFDRRSFRTVASDGHRVTVGCPRGQYDARRRRCRVATRAQRILHPEGEGRCPIGGRELGNPPARLTRFYDGISEVRGVKGRRFGYRPGTRFRHPFTTRPRAYGVDRAGAARLRRGDVVLRGPQPIYAQLGGR